MKLAEYLAGTRGVFELPLVADGDVLQRTAWDLVAQIPYGATTGYGELAAEIGGGITASRSGPPSATTRCASSCPVTAWWDTTESSPATPAGSPASGICSTSNATRSVAPIRPPFNPR